MPEQREGERDALRSELLIQQQQEIERLADALADSQERERELREALEWALDVLEICYRRIDEIDGKTLSAEHYTIREAGMAKARRALDSTQTHGGSDA